MKKRILALVLVLVIALATTVSAFAATRAVGPCPYCGSGSFSSVSPSPTVRYGAYDRDGHDVYYGMYYICHHCANQFYGEDGPYRERHFGSRCICGF